MSWDCLELEVAAEMRCLGEYEGRPGSKAHAMVEARRVWVMDKDREYCRACYQRYAKERREAKMALRASRTEAGLCPTCGRRPPKAGLRQCEPCRAHARRHWRAYYRRHGDPKVHSRKRHGQQAAQGPDQSRGQGR